VFRFRIRNLAIFGLVLSGCLLVPHFQDASESEDQRLAKLGAEIRTELEEYLDVRFRDLPKLERIASEHRCDEVESASRSGWVAASAVDPTGTNDRLWRAAGLLKPSDTVSTQRNRLDCFASRSLYQVNAKRILVLLDSLHRDERRVLTHEMVHALQDQQGDLRAMLARPVEPDERIAVLAAVEGTAEYVSGKLAELGKTSSGCGGSLSGALWELDKALGKIPHLANAPPSVSIPAYVPYVFGERLACRMVERHGKAGLDSLLARPPSGTWQLWHLDDYMHDIRPTDWDTAWAFLPALPKGWTPLGQARAGEARLAALPLVWNRKVAKKLLLGRGLSWRGDRLWVASSDDGARSAILWRLAFTDQGKAMDFARGWWALRETRLGRKLPAWKKRAKSASWTDSTRVAYLVRVEGTEVGIGEGFDSLATHRLLARTMVRPRRGS